MERNKNHELGTGFFVRKINLSAVKRVEFVNDRMSYIILRGRWCDVIALNVYDPTRDKTDDTMDRVYEELESVYAKFANYHTQFY
jgi:hypothetical protein